MAILHFLYKLLRRFFVADVTHLMRLREAACDASKSADDIEFRQLAASDVLRFAEDPSNDLDPSMVQRLNDGRNVCIAALIDGDLAGYGWYALNFIEAEHNRGESIHSGTGMTSPESIAFLYKGFVHSRFRGRRVYGQLQGAALSLLRECGVQEIVATADWTNASALKSCYRCGFEYVGHVARFGVSRWTLGWLPRAAKDMGMMPRPA